MRQGDFDSAMKFHLKALKQAEILDNKYAMAYTLNAIGGVIYIKGDLDLAMDYFTRSMEIKRELNDKRGIIYAMNNFGWFYYFTCEYEKALQFLEEGLNIKKILNHTLTDENGLFIELITLLHLTKKKLDIEYNKQDYLKAINASHHQEYFETNYIIYLFLKNKYYLETAYNQVQETANNLEPDVKLKFLSYPIPKAIVEEWEKVK